METYTGHVKTPQDAIILFEACRQGQLPRVQRRLSEKERQLIKSGSVFVWDEREAGMRRWTDGKSWSASRVNGSFLTYREMEGKRSAGSNYGNASSPAVKANGHTNANGETNEADGGHADGPDGYRYKPDGLTKQSFSITTNQGQHLHLISYFSRSHLSSGTLTQPTSDPTLRHIRPDKDMYPESTLQDHQNTPAMTRSPMVGPPVNGSPSVHSVASTPQYAQPRTGPPGYQPPHGWLPSPMNTPPMPQYSPYSHSPYAHSPYSSGHPSGTPIYHNALYKLPKAPSGPSALDRMPGAVKSTMPPPPPNYQPPYGYPPPPPHGPPGFGYPYPYPTYPPPPPTTAAPYPYPPPPPPPPHIAVTQAPENQLPPYREPPLRDPPSSSIPVSEPHHVTAPPHPPPPPPQSQVPSPSSSHSNPEHTGRPSSEITKATQSTTTTIPSIDKLINKSPPREPDVKPTSSGRDAPGTTAYSSPENKKSYTDDTRLLRRLDKAFVA